MLKNFSPAMPTEPGLYLVVCDESDGRITYVAIIEKVDHSIIYEPQTYLVVCDRDIGRVPLEHYHYNLSNIKWKKVA